MGGQVSPVTITGWALCVGLYGLLCYGLCLCS